MTSLAPVCPVRLKKGQDESVRRGMPWIYAGDLIESSEPLLASPGSLVAIENYKGQRIGTGYFNARSQIACRVLALGDEKINAAFFHTRLSAALAARERLVGVPYYRLAHAESDRLPGLLIDRFGEYLSVQVGTAGMEALMPLWLPVLESLIAPKALVFRNDTSARALEGLAQDVTAHGIVPELVEVQENGCIYLADLLRGQKTGWFYDQRDNRRMIAELAKDKTVADIYSHSGGFALLVAKARAAQVTLVDSSKLALGFAEKAAARNSVGERCTYLPGDAFAMMEQLRQEKKQFDIVLADPPAFVKTRKDIASGLKGYEKVARLATTLVKPGGLLFVASCSHHATRPRFNQAVLAGVEKAGADATILKQTGAAPDHPRHPQLPQSEYLKGILLKIDCPSLGI